MKKPKNPIAMNMTENTLRVISLLWKWLEPVVAWWHTPDKAYSVHQVTVTLTPYPWWSRFSVALKMLLFGEFEFRGRITDVSSPDNSCQAKSQDQPP